LRDELSRYRSRSYICNFVSLKYPSVRHARLIIDPERATVVLNSSISNLIAKSTPASPLCCILLAQNGREALQSNTYSQSPDRHSSHETEACPKSKRLEDISASSYPTINSNWDLPSSNMRTFSQCIERSWCTVKLSSSVIRDDNTTEPIMDCELDVFRCIDFTNPLA
jgi:hypothetical protein